MLTIGPRNGLAAAATAIILLSACGQAGDKAGEDKSAPDPAPPTAPDPGTTPPTAAVPPPTTVVQPTTPGVWTSGPLTIRAETANLRVANESFGTMALGMTVTFENASTGPISIAIAQDGWPRIQLDNGLNMQPDDDGVTVLRACSRAFAECRQGQKDRFVEIEGGKSLSVTMTFEGRYPEGGREDAQTVDSGTVGMRLHMLEGDGLNRTLDVSLKDAPITNRIN